MSKIQKHFPPSSMTPQHPQTMRPSMARAKRKAGSSALNDEPDDDTAASEGTETASSYSKKGKRK